MNAVGRRLLVRPGVQRFLAGAARVAASAQLPWVAAPSLYNASISHSHEFVWFRVAKAGTRSVLAALEASGAAPIDHLSGAVLPASLLRRYRSWAFVRDPADRLESCWRDKVCRSNRWCLDEDERTPSGFVDWVVSQDLLRGDRHLRMQSSLVPRDAVVLIGRIESFERDLAAIFDELGLRFEGAPGENRTWVGGAAQWPHPLRARVRDLYAADCDAFGY